MYNCETCSKNFSGVAPYKQHLNSEKHKKKVTILQHFSTEIPDQTKSCEVKILDRINCPACNETFDSVLEFTDHSLSLGHAENVARKQAVDIVNGSIDQIQSVNSTTLGSYDECNLQKSKATQDEDFVLPSFNKHSPAQMTSFLECRLCSKHFTGPEPYKQHIESVMHRKKVEMSNYFSGSSVPNPVHKFECKPCNKTFSGYIPLQQHMVSDVHRKKLKQLSLLEEFSKQNNGLQTCLMEVDGETNIKNTDLNRSWFCAICMVPCSGLVSYQQHIAGDAHSKRVKRQEILTSASNLQPENNTCLDRDEATLPTKNLQRFVSPMQHIGLRNTVDVDSDHLLPETFHSLAIVQPEQINVREFLPDDKINFDDYSDKGNVITKEKMKNGSNIECFMELENSSCTNNTTESVDGYHNGALNNQQGENKASNEKGIEDVYEKCELCNILLKTKKETLLHYESLEHIIKKYPSFQIC